MKSVSISGSLRENVGKKDAKAQRRKGFIPCVMYGGAQQYTFVVEEKQFQPLFYTPEVKYAVIDLDGKKYNAIVQDSQWHPVSDKLLHVDFWKFQIAVKLILVFRYVQLEHLQVF